MLRSIGKLSGGSVESVTVPEFPLQPVADLGAGCGPLGVLQKNSGSANFENSEDSRQHDYYNYQFLPCS